MADVVVSDRAADWLRDAEPNVRDRIMNKFHNIEGFPDHYLKRLSGSPPAEPHIYTGMKTTVW
ncbi:hypothetical protein BRC87_03245 [Halobacteriales archaeon QS_4_66_20]|nr:MAG: hypothetical protein BRC87_03245 [Halobacteriales archaeon QS_4_66_20]